MTAKEIAEIHRCLNGNRIFYDFGIKTFKEFCEQLCKEQRQLVANELKTWTEDICIPNQYKIDDLCMNADAPDL